MLTRDTIQVYARGLVGTEWHHQGRDGGAGIDCIGVLIKVALKTGYFDSSHIAQLDDIYKGYYSTTPSDYILVEKMREFFDEISLEEAREGDILVLKMAGTKYPKHLGILTKGPREMLMVHTLGEPRFLKVVEEPILRWKKLCTNAFRFKGLEN